MQKKFWQWKNEYLKCQLPEWIQEISEEPYGISCSNLTMHIRTNHSGVSHWMKIHPGDWIVSISDEVYVFSQMAYSLIFKES
jgi:hypothetical protein